MFSGRVRRIREFLVDVRNGDKDLINELCRLHTFDDVISEFIQQSSLWLSFPIDHAYVAKQLAECLPSQILLSILPFLRIAFTLLLGYSPYDLCLQNVCCRQIKAPRVENRENSIRRI